jgi:hypothetical protein
MSNPVPEAFVFFTFGFFIATTFLVGLIICRILMANSKEHSRRQQNE